MNDLKLGDVVFMNSDLRHQVPMTITKLKKDDYDNSIEGMEVSWLSTGHMLHYMYYYSADPFHKYEPDKVKDV